MLYRGGCPAVVSPDPERVITGLLRHVDAHAPTPPGLLAVQAVALVREGRVLLVPTLIEDDLRDHNRQLGLDGIQLLDSHTIYLDPERGELVVQTSLDVDRSALEAAIADAPAARRLDPPVPDGRYPIEHWLMMDLWHEPAAFSRVTATRRAALVLRGGLGKAGEGTLGRLAALFSSVPATGIDPQGRDEILALARESW